MRIFLIALLLLGPTTTLANHVKCDDGKIISDMIVNVRENLDQSGFEVFDLAVQSVKEDLKRSSEKERSCYALIRARLKQSGVDVDITYYHTQHYTVGRKIRHN